MTISELLESDLSFTPGTDLLPVAVHCVAEEGEEPRQSHLTIGVVEKQSDGQWVLKAIKQKLFVDGLCYLLQEIYGIENKVVGLVLVFSIVLCTGGGGRVRGGGGRHGGHRS